MARFLSNKRLDSPFLFTIDAPSSPSRFLPYIHSVTASSKIALLKKLSRTKHMRPAAFFALVLLAEGELFSTTSAVDTCTATPFTLTDACGGICEQYEPCLIFNASDTGDCANCTADAEGNCKFFCLPLNRQDLGDHSVTFLIPFGTYQSDKEIYERTQHPDYDSLVNDIPDERSSYSYASNNVLTTIESMALEFDTNSVTIAGGNAWDNWVKSKVVDVNLAADLFENTTNLTRVTLVSMNLEERIKDLPAMLPQSLQALDLSNTLLSSFPTGLSSLSSLEDLYLNFNYIASIESTDTVNSITYLWLEYNLMSKFEGYFPNLVGLDLYMNNLTEFPSIIFQHSKLKMLYIDGNSFETPEFTSDQIKFFQGLTALDLTPASFASGLNCDSSQQVVVHNFTACVVDETIVTPTPTPSPTPTKKSSSNTGLIIGVIAGGVVLVLAIVIGCLCYRRKRYMKADDTRPTTTRTTAYIDMTAAHSAESGQSRKSSNIRNSTMSIWNDPELLALQVQYEDIQDVMKIGNGASCVVWLVKYANSQLLVSKRIQKDHITWQRTREFINEIKLIAKLEHPSIVKFIGVAWTTESDIQALFEYMKNGDLRDHLSDPNTPHEWNAEKVQIAVDVIEALVYVHSFQPPLLHRDLKSRNILLSGNMRAKLTDFGIARFKSQTDTMTLGVGTSRWLAPEVLSSNNYGPAADIFSFGVVLSELDTHDIPYGDARTATGSILADVTILQMVADGRLRPTFHRSCPHEILELADRCLSHNPAERPTAVELAYALRTLQQNNF